MTYTIVIEMSKVLECIASRKPVNSGANSASSPPANSTAENLSPSVNDERGKNLSSSETASTTSEVEKEGSEKSEENSVPVAAPIPIIVNEAPKSQVTSTDSQSHSLHEESPSSVVPTALSSSSSSISTTPSPAPSATPSAPIPNSQSTLTRSKLVIGVEDVVGNSKAKKTRVFYFIGKTSK